MRAWITHDPIDAARLLAEASAAANGAVVLFTGIVREQNEGRAVDGVEYEAYVEMAERVLSEIVAEAAQRAESPHVFAVHRVGALGVGEASICIAVGTPHRAQAFDAARHVIEEVKVRLPVWKRELYVDDSARWLDGVVPTAVRDG